MVTIENQIAIAKHYCQQCDKNGHKADADALFAACVTLRRVRVIEAENARLREALAAACDIFEECMDQAGVNLDRRICCNGHDCGCLGATSRDQINHFQREARAALAGEE